MSAPVYLGIDLGTTNSAAAIFDGATVALVRSSQGGTLTPSVVRIDGRGNVLVGARARRFLDGDPDNTRGEFKRLMGTATRFPFAAAKLERRPEELAAEVLRSLRSDAKDQLGFAPERAVISVPALFELPQSAATSEAARLAGFTRVDLIQEPVASALAAGWSADDPAGSWLVYDLGGGTFDVSLLETRDGLLRVIGHDGDNFLGGRDFDWAIVDWAVAELGRQGVRIERGNPAHAAAVRKLKQAAEEAKLELARAPSTALTLPELTVGETTVDVDLQLDRGILDGLCLPLVERSLAVCQRLLLTHGLQASQLGRIVLVGGPTVMEVVRRRVGEQLGAPFGEGLDPMTLVAQGAAIYAATAGLDARPEEKSAPSAHRFWLQYPAMSSDFTPHVVGRLVGGGGGPAPVRVRLRRGDGGWAGEWQPLDGEQAFVTLVDLQPRRPNLFHLEAESEPGRAVLVEPGAITIVQGLTIADPPLSRTVGVALANDTVRVYFERGAPLPARRTFVHQTVESVPQGAADCLLKIPIVQGEFEQAHLCRLVGTLLIGGQKLGASLPAGSTVEVTLQLDRGGRLAARALVPTLGQVFEEVAHLLVPDAAPEVLGASVASLRDRLAARRGEAFRRGDARGVADLGQVEQGLAEVERDVVAAQGGDADAGQKARRLLLEIDAKLEEAEFAGRWPELDETAREKLAMAASWVSEYGTPAEQKLLTEAGQQVERARAGRDARMLQRQLRIVQNLANAAYYRNPEAWDWAFEHAASEIAAAKDLPKAESLVRDGRKAKEQGDKGRLREIVQQLWKLLPDDAESRRLGYDSGIR